MLFAVTVAAPLRAATHYVYDDLGRLVQVTFANGAAIHYEYDAVGNVVNIARINSNTVAISTFQPGSGSVGTAVTLHGSGFDPVPGQNAVRFNGVAANVITASSTQLTAIVPAGATTGPIAVTTSGGSAMSAHPFVVTLLAIAGFSPAVGLPGAPVTVQGSGFAPAAVDNQLQFLDTTATLSFASTTELRTTVPAGARSGPLKITTPAGTATSSVDFIVPPGGYLPANVVATGRLPINGEPQTFSIATANRLGVLLFDGVQDENRNVVLTGVTIGGGSYRIYTPSGSLFFTGSIRNNGVDDLGLLPETGIYSLVLIPGANTGNISVRVVTDERGEIPVDAPKSISLLSGQNADYTFEGIGGQGYSLVRTAFASTPSGATAAALIYGPDGTQFKSCGTFHSGSGNCDFVLPDSGTYRVRFNPGGVAATAFTVVLSADLSATLQFNAPPVKFLSDLKGQNIRYAFEAEAGQPIAFVFRNGVGAQGMLYIYRPDGSLLAKSPNGINGASSEVLDTVATTSGTHTAVVYIDGNASGNMDVNIATDENGTIAVNDSLTTALTYGQNGNYLFDGSGGQGYSLVRTSYTGSASDVLIYAADGTKVKTCADFHSGAGNCDFTLPASGTYRLRFNPTSSSAAAFTVVLSEDLAGTLEFNAAPVKFLASLPGQNIRYSFEASAGQPITFSYRNGVNAQGILYLYSPDGSLLAKLPNSFNGASTRFLDATATMGGTHSAVVYIDGNAVGNMDVSLATDENGTIPVNGYLTTTLASGQNGNYLFEATAGQGYSLVRTSYSGPASDVVIYRPDGTALKNCADFHSGSGNCDFTALDSGTHRLRLNPNNTGVATFTLALSEDLAAALELNAAPVQFAPLFPGQNIRYAFEASAGQDIRFQYTNGTSPQGILYLYKPDGSLLAKLPNELNTASSRYLDASIAATGTYTAVVYIHGNWAGTMNVSIVTR